MRESNSRQRFWRPLSYHLTNPLYINSMRAFHPHILYTFIFCFSIPLSFVPSKLHTDLQTPRKFDSLCSSNDQTTFSISLLPKNGHLNYASLRLDEFAPQTFPTSLTRQLLQQADSLSAGSVLPFFSAFGQALDRLVAVRCTYYYASTPVLST